MTEFNEGWWNCFCSFANELANVSSNASMVIRAVLDGAGVVTNTIIVYKYLPPKWARKEMKGLKGGYSNKDFINHLAEDLHSEVGIKIHDEK